MIKSIYKRVEQPFVVDEEIYCDECKKQIKNQKYYNVEIYCKDNDEYSPHDIDGKQFCNKTCLFEEFKRWYTKDPMSSYNWYDYEYEITIEKA